MTIHAIDASGGLTKDDFANIVDRIKKTATSKDSVILFDTDIRVVTHVCQIDNINPSMGCGGTLFQPVIDWAKDIGEKIILLYTDGYNADSLIDMNGVDVKMVHFGDHMISHHKDGIEWVA